MLVLQWLAALNPETAMSITDGNYRKAQCKSETLEGLMSKHPLASSLMRLT